MTYNNAFLGTEPLGKLLRRLAIPTVAAQVINMLYNVVDRIYIGHMPGDGSLALTGVGVCLPLIMIISAFAQLVGSGGAPRASIAMGKGDNDEAENILGSCFTALVVLSVILTAVILVGNRSFLLAFGCSANTIEYAVDYMSIYAVGTIFVQLTLGMNSFITAQGYTTISMKTVLIGAVCNIILDPICIFALDMGVKGAALATVISQAVSAVWVILFLTGKKSLLRLKRKNIRLNMKVVLPCIALGASPFIMSSTESLISVCFNSSLLKYGGDMAVGAMTILTSVAQFMLLPVQGITQGSQPIISYNYGAGNTSRVKGTFFLLVKVCLGWTMFTWLLVMIFPQLFASIFTSDAALIDFTKTALRIYLGSMGLFGIQMACQMTFVSIGNAVSSITVAVMRKIILLIPLIYIMPHILADKTLAVYAAEPVADFLSVCFASTLFFFQFRKALRNMDASGR